MRNEWEASKGRTRQVLSERRGIGPAIALGAMLAVSVVAFAVSYSNSSSTISSLNGTITSQKNQLSNDTSTINSLTTQVNSLTSQVSNLNSLLSLSKSTIEANAVTVNQPAGGISSIVSFSPNYAGYLFISGTSTTTNGYVKVNETFSGGGTFIDTVSFGTGPPSGSGYIVPVSIGAVTVSFGNTNSVNGATATISVTYYY